MVNPASLPSVTRGAAPRARPGLRGALQRRASRLFDELAKFGTVGAMSYVLDLAVFNALLSVVPDRPLLAKTVSTVVGATNAFVLNRAWSFRRRARSTLRREAALFALFNGCGLGIALAVLAVSHYVLGFDSRLADNIAANGVGLVLGSLFRFWSYRRFVWTAPVDEAARPERLTPVSPSG